MPVAPTPNLPGFDTVVVIDFGAQYAQLIARRVRESGVFSVIVPHTASLEQIRAHNPKAIILSGGPSSVYADEAPGLPTGLLDAEIPTFGICYGFQAMAHELGGEVARTGEREYGRTSLALNPGATGVLLRELPAELTVWMSHG